MNIAEEKIGEKYDFEKFTLKFKKCNGATMDEYCTVVRKDGHS